uniref:Retrotransposon gag domain-containing protein n=1 Tax=Bracon brevicornis TaxID=1563983 RepID=A0A6V7J748_9HYME
MVSYSDSNMYAAIRKSGKDKKEPSDKGSESKGYSEPVKDIDEPCDLEKVMRTADLVVKMRLYFSAKRLEDRTEFLSRLKAVYDCSGLTFPEFRKILPLMFKGRASIWFRIDEPRMHSYEDFSRLFTLNFLPDDNKELMYAKAIGRKQKEGEPVMCYLQDMEILLHDNPNMPHCHMIVVIDNLLPYYRGIIYYSRTKEEVLERYKTFDDLKATARKWDTIAYNRSITRKKEEPLPVLQIEEKTTAL